MVLKALISVYSGEKTAVVYTAAPFVIDFIIAIAFICLLTTCSSVSAKKRRREERGALLHFRGHRTCGSHPPASPPASQGATGSLASEQGSAGVLLPPRAPRSPGPACQGPL